MLDEKDLQAIAQLLSKQKDDIIQDFNMKLVQQRGDIMQDVGAMLVKQREGIMQDVNVKLAEQREGIMQDVDVKLAEQKREIIQEVNVLMEAYFDPKFNLLSEKMDIYREEALTRNDAAELTSRVDTLEVVVKLHDQKIHKLENALIS